MQKRHLAIEGQDGRLVFAWAKRGVKESGRRLPFETKLTPDATAGIDEECDVERQIRFGAEIWDVLKPVVFKDIEVIPLEIRDELAPPTRNREQHIHTLDIDGERLIAAQAGLMHRLLRCLDHTKCEETQKR